MESATACDKPMPQARRAVHKFTGFSPATPLMTFFPVLLILRWVRPGHPSPFLVAAYWVLGQIVATAAIGHLWPLLFPTRNPGAVPSTNLTTPNNGTRLPSYILPCITSHRRLLPVRAAHAFRYPLIYLGVDLDDLQDGALDLPSRAFTYGSSPWKTMLGISARSYLLAASPARDPEETTKTFKQQLLDLVSDHGISSMDVGRVWMITMPSYLGHAGINPLTVYLCYTSEEGDRSDPEWETSSPESEGWVRLGGAGAALRRRGTQREKEKMTSGEEGKRKLLCVVLEVHNTFGERHMYVLKVGVNQETTPLAGHDLGWIFPRTFHVSPFNDRAGFYRLDVLDPFPPSWRSGSPPQPFKITLNQLTEDKRFKLYAVLMNHPERTPLPITTGNIFRSVILRQPFDLFVTTPRILYQAYLLHYAKKLLVYPRPEPAAEPGQTGLGEPWNPAGRDPDRVGVGIGWQGVGPGEKVAQRVICRWLREECERRKVGMEIGFSNPSRGLLRFGLIDARDGRRISIWTRHPGFFTELLMARSPDIFLLSAETDKHTRISPPELFLEIFSTTPTVLDPPRFVRYVTDLRYRHFLFLASFAKSPIPPGLVVSQGAHFLDRTMSADSWIQAMWIAFVVAMQYAGDRAEEWIMHALGARFVTGREPWGTTARLVEHSWGKPIGVEDEGDMGATYGSAMMDA